MDNSAVNTNVTVDDFDSVITFEDESQWSTPDPSQNLPFNPNSSPWLYGTYHQTNIVNASITFNFEGPALFIYGASGPDYGSYEVSINGNSVVQSAHAVSNASNPHLLFSTSSLQYSRHILKLTNLGTRDGDAGAQKFLFDYIQTTVQLAPSGASVTNTTVEEKDSRLTYTGSWVDSAPNQAYSGGGSRYTGQDGATVSLSFHGSALYIFGDVVNDHGLFSVKLDNSTEQQFNGVAGCGGAFTKSCEKTNTLTYFASNLDGDLHTVTLRNIGGPNNSFFDLDRIVYTVPSQYGPRLSSSPPSTSSSPTSAGPSSSVATPTNGASLVHSSNLLLVLLFGVFYKAFRS